MNPEHEKILYIDHFYPQVSSDYWKEALEKFGEVCIHNVYHDSLQNLENKIITFQPTHIHMGGGVKTDTVPLNLLGKARRQYRCSTVHLYGDARFMPYLFRTAQVVDLVYFPTQTHIDWAKARGLENYDYLPQATDAHIYRPHEIPKQYDVIFIGNNNDLLRIPVLQAVADRFDLTIFGNNWEGTGFKSKPPIYREDYGKTVSAAKVVLSIFSDRWRHLKSCFSNRLLNSLASGGCVVQTYTEGLENVFQHGEHLFSYCSTEELLECIERALSDEELRNRVAHQGREKVLANFTFEKTIESILKKVRGIRKDFEQRAVLISSSQNASLHINKSGLASSPAETARIPLPPAGQSWQDGFGILTAESRDLIFEQDAVPEAALDRFDVWMQCRQVMIPNRRLILNTGGKPSEQIRSELRLFGFRPEQIGDSSRLSFVYEPTKETQADRFYKKLMASIQPQFGLKPLEVYSMEWCVRHPLTKKIQESNLGKGNTLFLWSALGEWPFALSISKEDGILVGIESSWPALDYARITYGSSHLRFFPPYFAGFPSEFFDSILFITYPARASSIRSLIKEAKRITKPEAKVFIGLFPFDSPVPLPLQNPDWLSSNLEKKDVIEWEWADSCFSAVVPL